MKEKNRKANWNDYPAIEECTDMGDTNGNKMNVEMGRLEDRIIRLKDENRTNIPYCKK